MPDTSAMTIIEEIRNLRLLGGEANNNMASLLQAMLDELESKRRAPAPAPEEWEDRMGGQFTQEEINRPGWL